MKTKVIKISASRPNKKIITKAARVIRNGGLVAFPTETVYGLGANALDHNAVRKIFVAKKRPSDNPLIVHIADLSDLDNLVINVSASAKKLIRAFWPGPLTLVFRRKSILPTEVTARGQTVAIRMPGHPVAIALIKASGVPIAAPSANLAGRPSATSARDVKADLGDKIDLILDAGSTKFGLESTVVDFSGKKLVILRPGAITKEALEKFLGKNVSYVSEKQNLQVRSPGMKHRHYAPNAKVILIPYGDAKNMANQERRLVRRFQYQGKRVGILATLRPVISHREVDDFCYAGSTLNSVGKNLFRCLRELDKNKVDIILAEAVPEQGLGLAIMNRLTKSAAAKKVTDR